MDLTKLSDSLNNCQLCQLSAGRTQVVFGTGNPHASIMFVGEAPGFYEDREGEPFVGAAGKLLTELLRSIGLERSDIYIANVIKCRPPNNRDPLPDEIDTCKPFLLQQIQLIQPKLVCTSGKLCHSNPVRKKSWYHQSSWTGHSVKKLCRLSTASSRRRPPPGESTSSAQRRLPKTENRPGANEHDPHALQRLFATTPSHIKNTIQRNFSRSPYPNELVLKNIDSMEGDLTK